MSFRFGSHSGRTGTALAILRIVTGVIMAAHGWQKLFTMGIGGVTGFFTQVGIPMPGVMAPLIAFIELAGGLALIVGLLTRLASLGIMVDLVGAIIFVHFKNGFLGPMGIEYPMLIVASALTLFLAGPGSYAVDNGLATRGQRTTSP